MVIEPTNHELVGWRATMLNLICLLTNWLSESLSEGFGLGHLEREDFWTGKHGKWRLLSETFCHTHGDGGFTSTWLTTDQNGSSRNLLVPDHLEDHTSGSSCFDLYKWKGMIKTCSKKVIVIQQSLRKGERGISDTPFNNVNVVFAHSAISQISEMQQLQRDVIKLKLNENDRENNQDGAWLVQLR